MPHRFPRVGFALLLLLSLIALPARFPATAAQELQNTPSNVLSDSPISGFELRTVIGGPGVPTKSIHWWSTLGLTNCNGEFPNSAKIKLVPSLSAVARTLEPQTCRLLDASSSNVVRDGQFVYFYADGEIRRKAIGAAAADLAQVMTRVTIPSNNELLSPLALDSAGRLYYATYGGGVSSIFRLPADDSAAPVGLVAIGARVTKIVPARFGPGVNAETGGIVLVNNGDLLRWDVNSSTPLRTLASDIETFAVHSYNFSLSGSIGRVVTVFAARSGSLLKINAASGSQSTIFTATGDNRITSVTTDSDGAPANRNVYLSETSYVFNPFPAAVDTSIRRAPLTADATGDWDLILAEGGGTNLRSDDQKLYFLNNKNLSSGSAILSLPTDAPAIQIDIEAVDLEANQAIQSFDPAFPLIENHPTYVRAYARIKSDSTAKNSYSVTGQLRGTLNGVSLGTLQAERTFEVVPESTRSLADIRRDATLTFLFELPDDWVENGFDAPLPGILNLSFSVNSNGDPPETTLANNSVSRAFTTFQRYRPCLMFVPVRTEAPLPSYNIPNWSSVMARTLSYFPFGSFRTFLPWNSTDLEGNYILSDGGDPYDFSEQGGDGDAIDDLNLLQFFADIPESCENDWHFVGIIHPKTNWTFKNDDDQSVSRGGLGVRPDMSCWRRSALCRARWRGGQDGWCGHAGPRAWP
ncbi:hypothetical protein HC891_07725 [Candidatus Gracilibacteria bacterium]|nr:hypothetical protein [Candidatus Gracilibacteria bacterium]